MPVFKILEVGLPSPSSVNLTVRGATPSELLTEKCGRGIV